MKVPKRIETIIMNALQGGVVQICIWNIWKWKNFSVTNDKRICLIKRNGRC